MEGLAVQFEGVRRREIRQWFAVSVVLHLSLVAVFFAAPEIEMASPLGVISVDLVAAPASPRKNRSVARPRPPTPPVPKKVVLPAKPSAPAPEVVAKPAPKRAVVPEPKPVVAPEPVEQDYSDILDQLRAEAGEDVTPPEEDAQPALVGAGGTGRPVSPEVAAWLRLAEIHVRRVWVMPPGFRMQPLVAVVSVDLDREGHVVGEPKLERRSGNPWYDDNVVRGIRKASPLPAPPESGEWTFVFDAEEGY